MSHTQTGAVPRLLPDLKLALVSLYSLPVPHGMQVGRHPSPKEANDFLIHIQSRNARRRVISLQQRQRDQLTPNKKNTPQADADEGPVIGMGSSWLACLALLCQQKDPGNPMIAVSTTERLFAAQTMLHRSRRQKLVEAVDLEAEQDQDLEESQALGLYLTNDHLLRLLPAYNQWLQGTNSFVAAVLQSYQFPSAPTIEDEERIKGELTLMTLAAVSYLTACESHNDNHTQPILSTLGSTMAAIALRLRFTPISIEQHGGPVPNSQPLVTLVTHALVLVWNTANSMSMANHAALGVSLHACLASIPDTLLGSPGGARGRFSIDPRCLQAATQELRTTGLTHLWETLQQHEQGRTDDRSDLLTLLTCERWAKFLPVPDDFLQHTIPLVNKYISKDEAPQYQRAALAYLIAICESGAWTLEQVLTANLGIVDSLQSQQSGKKKQTSRSKKRHKEVLNTHTTDTSMAQAQAEVQHRGEIACKATMMVWDELDSAAQKALAAAKDPNLQVEGEGPVGCLASSANACLPHLIRYQSLPYTKDLFTAIAGTFQEFCASPNRTVRALSLEPLYTLHTTVITVVQSGGRLDEAMESLLVDHYFKCAMSLASTCGYPTDYFDDLGAESDDELEVYRNDIRDLLRAVAGTGDSSSTSNVDSSTEPVALTSAVLSKLLRVCFDAASSAHHRNELAPETAIHALSALAKPLNHLAKHYAKSGTGEQAKEVLLVALNTLAVVHEMIDNAFRNSSQSSQLLPLTRISNIATSSLAPMLAALCSCPGGDGSLLDEIHRVVGMSVRTATFSIIKFPELPAQSVYDPTQSNARGALRSPGGEDHVGCLSLMRLTFATQELTLMLVKASGPFIPRLCELHGQLKSIETERGRGVLHGRGVCPKSRRILLRVLCHIETISGGQTGASGMLTGLFNSAVDMIASFNGHTTFDERVLFEMTELSFDIAAFSPMIIASLFKDDGNHQQTDCLKTMTRACVQGYHQQIQHSQAAIGQWNRLRAALFEVLKVAADPDFPDRAVEMVNALVYAECEAIAHLCRAGPSSHSAIFHEDVISLDAIPAGLFIRVLDETIQSACSTDFNPLGPIRNTIESLYASKGPVLVAITLECPDPYPGCFADPRPTLSEAWFLAMTRLTSCPQTVLLGAEEAVKSLLVESCMTALSILFYPTLGRTQEERKDDPGMSLDGAQTLALTEFLESFFGLGPGMFQVLAHELLGRIPVDLGTGAIQKWSNDQQVHGRSIVGAALFRAAQGALPPWAVESIPEVYSAFFVALGKDPERFGLVLRGSMELRLQTSVERFGGVMSGQLLSGGSFETMTDTAKATFITQLVDLSRKDNHASWRRLKAVVKQACGGKKKEADFNQKPSPTKWDYYDRL